MFRCNLPPALLAEWPESFTCHCGNTGADRTLKKSQHTKLTLEKKILPPLLPGFELAAFRSRVLVSRGLRSTQVTLSASSTAVCKHITQWIDRCLLQRQRMLLFWDIWPGLQYLFLAWRWQHLFFVLFRIINKRSFNFLFFCFFFQNAGSQLCFRLFFFLKANKQRKKQRQMNSSVYSSRNASLFLKRTTH